MFPILTVIDSRYSAPLAAEENCRISQRHRVSHDTTCAAVQSDGPLGRCINGWRQTSPGALGLNIGDPSAGLFIIPKLESIMTVDLAHVGSSAVIN